MFDRALCCRQLRYSGMMETAKIRQNGYPIRHNFSDFVNQFRYLCPNIPPAHKTDCVEASRKICARVFADGQDYQIGRTKVFLKAPDNDYLEQERRQMLDKFVVLMQKTVRGWLCRKRYETKRRATIVFQKHWRSRGHRKRFLLIRNGYHRLQVRILSRQLVGELYRKRTVVVKIQALARGYLGRTKKPMGKIYAIVLQRKREETELKKAGNRNYKYDAELNLKNRLAELDREITLKESQVSAQKEDPRADKLVDELFGFLKDSESAASTPTDSRDSEDFVVSIHGQIKHYTVYR